MSATQGLRKAFRLLRSSLRLSRLTLLKILLNSLQCFLRLSFRLQNKRTRCLRRSILNRMQGYCSRILKEGKR